MPIPRKNTKTVNNITRLRNKLIFEKGDFNLLHLWSRLTKKERIEYLRKAHKEKKI